MRKFVAVTGKPKPDGLVNIWVLADRGFSRREFDKKAGEVTADILHDCEIVLSSFNEEFHAEVVEKHAEGGLVALGTQNVIEFVVPNRCKTKAIKSMKKNWGGKWKVQEQKIKKTGK